MAKIEGFEELSRQLSELGTKLGGQALRSAAMSAMLPALRKAQAMAPRANPPYIYGNHVVDPYRNLKKTYKGRRVAPGFTSRNIARKAIVSRDKTRVSILLGVKSEAFYALQFLELGTSRIAKRPWLEPAFRATRQQVIERLGARLKVLIDKAAKKK